MEQVSQGSLISRKARSGWKRNDNMDINMIYLVIGVGVIAGIVIGLLKLRSEVKQ